MKECPYCGELYNDKGWGIHTINCEKNPKNKSFKKYAVTEPEKVKKPRKKKK